MPDTFLSHQLLETITNKLYAQQHKPGLYVVATPIGNILDITFRAVYILKLAKCVFAEDTRLSKKLLNFYDIKTPLIACHEHNEINNSVTSLIEKGEIFALISDAGTPTISDPGYRILNWCINQKIDVFPIPGACSLIAALSASGLPTDSFIFYGFLPTKLKSNLSFLNNIKDITASLVFLESAKRMISALVNMMKIFGDRYCCVCREITKIFEEFKRGTLSCLIKYFEKNEPIGEFVIIVSGNKENKFDEKEMINELSKLLNSNSLKNSAKEIADKYNLSKSVVYKKAIEIKRENHEF